MEIKPVEEILRRAGFGLPTLNVLIPNVNNYSTLLMQPQGDIEVDDHGVRSFNREVATEQFSQFLSDADKTQADLVVTPEYAMPWNVLLNALENGVKPSPGKLWALGCESIKLSELSATKAEIAPYATMIYESLEINEERFLGALFRFVWILMDPSSDLSDAQRSHLTEQG